MGKILNWIRGEPPLCAAIVSLVGAVFSSFIHDPQLAIALGGVFLTLVGIRQVVTPVTTAVSNVTEAATTAATKAIESVDATTVGVVGNVTKAGTDIINNVVDQTVGQILGRK